MQGFDFEWDDAKAAINIVRHEVSFEEAATAFYDTNAQVLDDQEHSDVEERRRLIGISSKGRPLLVVYTLRGENRIRLISARKATSRERNVYGKES